LSQRFTFDAEDRLVSVTTEETRGTVETRFEYDPIGRRIASSEMRRSVSGTDSPVQRKRFVWQGLRMVQEVRDSGTSSYVYSPDERYTPLARLDALIGGAIALATIDKARTTSKVYHFHTDLVGTPMEVTDEAGELAWAGKYSAWGKVEHGEDALLMERIDQPLRYPGQYEDKGTGLHYNTFRYYDPDVGRYLSQDPIGLMGGENLYSYVLNSLGWFDALGLMPWPEPSNVGHHLVPQNLARSTGDGIVSELLGSNTRTPTFFFSQPYQSGSHEQIHAAQRPFVGKLRGSWTGTPAELVRASGKGLGSVSHIRGDLKIPATGQVLATNVTPREAYSKLLKWMNEQKKARGLTGCK
jgi:RHS repeat-associated protein